MGYHIGGRIGWQNTEGEGYETFTGWLVHLMSLVSLIVFCFSGRNSWLMTPVCNHMFGEHVLLLTDARYANQLWSFLFYVQKFPLKELQGFDSTQTFPSQLSMV